MNKLAKLKIQLLCYGVRLGSDTLKRFPGYRYKRASLSEGVCFMLDSDSDARVSVNVAVHEDFVNRSPFYFNEPEGIIYKADRPVVAASVVDRPAWYQRKLPDGVFFEEVFQIHHDRILAASLTNFCAFKEQGKGCKFCALGSDASRRRYKRPEHIVRVMEELKTLGVSYEEVNFNSGALLDEEEGISMFVKALRAVRSVSPIPVYAQICPPQNKRLLDELLAEGLTTISFNLEIYDPALRRAIMPAKQLFDRERYFDLLRYAVGLFGPNQVSSWLIAGLEPPESSIEGLRRVAETGAIPFVTVFRPLKGSDFVDKPPLDPESLFPVFEALAEVMESSDLDSLDSHGGCARCNCCSVLREAQSGQ